MLDGGVSVGESHQSLVLCDGELSPSPPLLDGVPHHVSFPSLSGPEGGGSVRDELGGLVACDSTEEGSPIPGGTGFPYFASRPRIFDCVLQLKKSPGGTAVSSSSTSDNEDSTTVVGASEVSSVKRPIGPLIPEFFQPPEEGSKRPSSVRRQDTGDVLPQNNSWARETNQSKEVKSKYPTIVRESASQPLDGEGLTRRSPDE